MKTMITKLLHMLCWEENIADSANECCIDSATLCRLTYAPIYNTLSFL